MLGMTAVRGGQSQTTGYVQPGSGLYKTRESRPHMDADLDAAARADHAGESQYRRGRRRHDVRRPSRQARSAQSRIVYAAAWNNGNLPIGAIARERRRVLQARLSPQSAARSSAISRCSISRSRTDHTRISVQRHGSRRAAGALSPGQCGRPASTLVTGSGRRLVNTSAWIRLSSDNPASRVHEPSHLRLAVFLRSRRRGAEASRTGRGRRRRDAIFGEPTIDRSMPARAFPASASTRRIPEQSHVDVRAVVFHPQRSGHRLGRLRRRCRPKRRHVHQPRQRVPSLFATRRSANHAGAGADAALFPEQGTADDAVLQRRAGSAGAAHAG